jgi:hypothetical protein
MAYACNDCGEKVYGGYCTWCHEEWFIAQQCQLDGEPIPDALVEKIATFTPKERKIARDVYGE